MCAHCWGEAGAHGLCGVFSRADLFIQNHVARGRSHCLPRTLLAQASHAAQHRQQRQQEASAAHCSLCTHRPDGGTTRLGLSSNSTGAALFALSGARCLVGHLRPRPRLSSLAGILWKHLHKRSTCKSSSETGGFRNCMITDVRTGTTTTCDKHDSHNFCSPTEARTLWTTLRREEQSVTTSNTRALMCAKWVCSQT